MPNMLIGIGSRLTYPPTISGLVDVGNDAIRRRQWRLLHRDDEDVLFIIQGFLTCQLHGA